MGNFIGSPIEIIIVQAFVDTYSPKEYGRVVSVLEDHLFSILDSCLLPILIPYMLPAWNLCEDQKADAVTFVYEVSALRIVAGPYSIAAQFILQCPGILPLHSLRCSVADVGPALVAVKAVEEELLSI